MDKFFQNPAPAEIFLHGKYPPLEILSINDCILNLKISKNKVKKELFTYAFGVVR